MDNYSNYTNREKDHEGVIKLLQGENLALKNALKEKIISNPTFNSLLTILELQREQINFLEEGNITNLLK
jgi:hypothetical protein